MSTGSPFAIVAGVGVLAAMLACGAPSPPPPSAPTVAAVKKEVAAAVKGEATLSPTLQAVATRVAPTVQALLQTVGPIATSVALSPVQITDVDVDPSNTTVTVRNSGSAAVNLEGWTLLLGPSIAIALRDIPLEPGQTRTLNLSSGTDTADNVFLGTASSGAIATTFAPGQRAVLIGPNDQVASILLP
jgi:hypothetical protein